MDILQLQHLKDRLETQFPNLPFNEDYKVLVDCLEEYHDLLPRIDNLESQINELEYEDEKLKKEICHLNDYITNFENALREIKEIVQRKAHLDNIDQKIIELIDAELR